jgi:hypothetical protein
MAPTKVFQQPIKTGCVVQTGCFPCICSFGWVARGCWLRGSYCKCEAGRKVGALLQMFMFIALGADHREVAYRKLLGGTLHVFSAY